MMRFKKLLVIGTAAVAVLASVTGAAMASGRGVKAPTRPAAEMTGTDTDNIQAGDQTSPDGGIQAPEGAATALTSAKSTSKATASTKATSAKSSASSGDENSGVGSGEGENSGESDGPGGHEDPPGQDVNHEFNGQE
jgi:hypothetical protein